MFTQLPCSLTVSHHKNHFGLVHFVHSCGFVDPCLFMCICAPVCAALVKLHLLLILLLLLPHQCYLTSSGPLTNPPNREKIEHFIGTPVRTLPGFMASRQCLSLNQERQSEKGWWWWGGTEKPGGRGVGVTK